MFSVWKYPIELRPEPTTLMMPQHAEIAAVGMQGLELVLWARGDTEAAKQPRVFVVCGTGREAPSPQEAAYVGTAQDAVGLVWHVFEKKWLQ